MRGNVDTLPVSQSMKGGHKVRRFRRGNAERGRAYLGRKHKPWKTPNNTEESK
jgi:hypothetical protein